MKPIVSKQFEDWPTTAHQRLAHGRAFGVDPLTQGVGRGPRVLVGGLWIGATWL